MKRPARWAPDAWALVGSACLLLIGLGWVIRGERQVAQVAKPVAALSGLDTAPPEAAPALTAGEWTAWSAPAVDAGGWGYDLFTPPVVYFDRATGRFTVSAAKRAVERIETAVNTEFGLSLVEVERPSYPLQLVGYAEEPGRTFGIFQNETTGDGVVAQAGTRFADLGLTVRNLEVRREDTIVPDSMPLRERVAVAEVWDEAGQRLVRLSSASWNWSDVPVAQVRLNRTGEVRAVRRGDRLETEAASYEIRSVAALPASVVVGKQLNDGTREEMTLWPAPPAAADPTYESTDPFAKP